MSDVLPRIATGDPDAMDECLNRYGGLVWSLANRMTRREDVDDAVQDCFVELWRMAERFDHRKGAETTFVAMVTRRRLIDRRRSSNRRIDATSLDSEALGALGQNSLTQTTNDEAANRDEAAQARKMMRKLRDDERRVLELAIDEGMSQSEIAAATGMALGTVKTNARRGMVRLRELMRAPSDGASAPSGNETKGGLR